MGCKRKRVNDGGESFIRENREGQEMTGVSADYTRGFEEYSPEVSSRGLACGFT